MWRRLSAGCKRPRRAKSSSESSSEKPSKVGSVLSGSPVEVVKDGDAVSLTGRVTSSLERLGSGVRSAGAEAEREDSTVS